MVRTLVQVNGIQLGVEQHGSRGSRSITLQDVEVRPQVLVLLHGFTGSAAGWGHQLDTLAAYGLRIIALDLLGHGQSDAPYDSKRYSIEHCQQDILAVLQKLGIHKGEAILLGYSMGGRIALYTAFSGYFRALILESASPGLEALAEREQRRLSDLALASSIEREGVPAFIESWENLPLFASQRTLSYECREALHRQRLQNNVIGLAHSLRGVGTGSQPSLYAQLPTLNIPVLLIAGALDTKFTAIAERMAMAIPQSQLHIIPDAGHAVHLEQPQLFTSLVGDFSLSLSHSA